MADLNLEVIKERLEKKYNSDIIKTKLAEQSIEYVFKKSKEMKKNKATGRHELAYNLNTTFVYQSIIECIDQGFALDGINFVLSGSNMYMPTYHAFKNKLYQTYQDSVIDLQLIRDGDEYSFAKESGSTVYSHTIADPFSIVESKIKGAYCIIKNSRGEFIEFLNATDYKKMRDSSKQPFLWDKWESEFWKKSVIKRACKTHFHDITEKLDSKDNEVIGLSELVKADQETKSAIIEAKKAQLNAESN
jgi:hypothetical protein